LGRCSPGISPANALSRSAQLLALRGPRRGGSDRDDAFQNAIIVLCMLLLLLTTCAISVRDVQPSLLTTAVAAPGMTGCFSSGALAAVWMIRASCLDATGHQEPAPVDDWVALVLGLVGTYPVLR